MKSNRKKVLVIGLDGATFDLLLPMMEKGQLPNLKRLIGEGVSGTLQSVVPPVTAPAWVSFMTGNMPGKHGIFDFMRYADDGRTKRVIHAQDIGSKTLWEILTEHEKTIGVFNVPVTYPPQKVKGFMWGGLLTPPDAGERMAYPSSLHKELERKIGKFIPDISYKSYKEDEKVRLIKDLTDCMKLKGQYTTYLMEKYDLDFFMTVITETDRIQHAFGNYLFNTKQKKDPNETEVQTFIDKFYQEMDTQVGQYCDLAGTRTSVFIVSDHGFGLLSKGFYVNQWLHRQGLLKIKDENRMDLSRRLLLLQRNPFLRSLIRRLDPKGLRRRFLSRKPGTDNIKISQFLHRFIDWGETKAYMDVGNQQGIYINVKGRQPMGIVEEGREYEEVRESIIEGLQKLTDPQSGKKMVTRVFKREEVYTGQLCHEAADIVFSLDNMNILATAILGMGDNLFFDPFWPITGHHRMNGICIASGNNIRKGETIKNAQLVDVMPTILYALGVPVPECLDGKVLTHIFTDTFRSSNPLQYMESSCRTMESKGDLPVLTEAENNRIEDTLRGLGYL